MPSVQYFNQSAPFWDWVAGYEERVNRSAADPTSGETTDEPTVPPTFGPFGYMTGGFPFQDALPHRGRPSHPDPHPGFPHHGPGAGPSGDHTPPPPPPDAGSPDEGASDEEPPQHPHDGRPPRREHAGPHRPHHPHHPHHHPHHHGRHPGPWGHRGGHGGRRGGRGGFYPGGHPHAEPRGLSFLTEVLPQLFNGFQAFGTEDNKDRDNATQEFSPEVDVFDTSDAFIAHVSLPGAKKEDIAVTWDAEKSELGVAGVVFRPGDEELLKTLALDERKVGAFDRKIRLGSRAKPAQVDVDGISAKVEDGILRITVPKLDSGFVEVKMVDVE